MIEIHSRQEQSAHIHAEAPEPTRPGLRHVQGVTVNDVDPVGLDGLINTASAAEAVDVAEHVIRTWRTRGWLDRDGQRKRLPIVGRDERGFPLHRYGDVLDAEYETRNSGKSHRRVGPAGGWAKLNAS